ncbi:MAG TPA: amidase family protein, partial [Ktedonobacterales bacterium]|nr:amidase family protein [Ktedonobacterales bacterium]
GFSEKSDAVFANVIETLESLGAVLVDPANLSSAKEMRTSEAELTVLLYEFKADLNAYLATLGPEAQAHSLEELIAFNQEHAAQEMPYFGQELLEMAQAKGPLTDQEYLAARAECLRLARDEGIDSVMREHNLDALCMPTGEPAWKIDLIDGDHSMGGASQPAALAGYPAISVPAGYTFGLPLGVTFMGLAFTEPKLVGFAYAFEQATKVRRAPTYPTHVP